MRDQKGHTISPGMVYYEEGLLSKKIHCLDCYNDMNGYSSTSSLLEEAKDDGLDIIGAGAAIIGSALGDDDSSSSFGDSDGSSSDDSSSSSDDSFDDGDGGGGGDSGDC